MDFDFNMILVPITLVLGLIWLLDKVWLKQHKRSQVTESVETKQAKTRLNQSQEKFIQALEAEGIRYDDLDSIVLDDASMQVKQAQREYRDAKRDIYISQQMSQSQQENFLIRWAHDYFFVLAAIVIVRSFIIEPFNIPSSSMAPTLYTGDFIAVNKYAYGIRLPLSYKKVIDIGNPEHGDVVVFRYPKSPRVYYIKRVIGLPGDTINYTNGVLSVNGKTVPSEQVNFQADDVLTNRLYKPVKSNRSGQEWALSPEEAVLMAENEERGARYYQEQLGDHTYLRRRLNPTLQGTEYSELFNKQLSPDSDWSLTVPESNYFVMGDNSDRSKDGRFWGYVPDANLAGKAVYVWMHKKPGLTNIPTFQYNRSID